jgi:hypothetical protein
MADHDHDGATVGEDDMDVAVGKESTVSLDDV